MTAALRTEGLGKSWGEFKANSDISITLPLGARHALIGPNGAGKTTFINLLTGVYPPTAGEVYLGDDKITHLAQHERVAKGMTRTYQINTLFPGLTVLESVVLAICERKKGFARLVLHGRQPARGSRRGMGAAGAIASAG
jgi:branched-chain amino acid transport system ATP-binding protein